MEETAEQETRATVPLVDTAALAIIAASTAQPGLTARTKLSWGVAGLGAEALRQSRNAWLIYFYTSSNVSSGHTRLSLALVSILIFGGKFIEAFVDPAIGHLSDRTTSRFGRRIPYVLVFTPPAALFAALAFMPPDGAGTLNTAIYFVVVLEVFFLLSSLVGVPFESLMPEIARSSAERISLAAWRVYFGVAGAVVGLVGSGLLISGFGYRTMAIAIATVALVTRYIGVIGVWPRIDRRRAEKSLPLRTTLRITLTNRRFVTFMLSFVLFLTGLTMVIGLLPFFVTNVLRETNTGLWSSLLTSTAIVAMMVAIPFFARLGHRASKAIAYRRAMLVSACTFPILAVAGAIPGFSSGVQALVAMAIIGAPLAGVYLFPGPIIADFCDADASASGLRREGVFYSALAFTDKLIESFGPLLLGLVLLLGNKPEHHLGIRLVGPVAGLLLLSGYLLLRDDARRAQLVSS